MKRAAFLGGLAIVGAALLAAPAVYSAETQSAPVTRLITEDQYVNTLKVVFGPGLKLAPRFAPIPRVQGLLAVGSSDATMTAGALDQFDTAARVVAEQVTGRDNREFLIPCQPKSATAADDRCAGEFLSSVGRLLFKRPLTSGETNAYVAAARQNAQTVNDFYRGLAVTLSSMLISPDFLYVNQPTETVRGKTRLTALGKASRLSLLLWNSYPDNTLLKAAESGALNTPQGLAAQVDRMIASPRLEAGVRSFFNDMLVFENFDTLSKDATTFPSFTFKVAVDAREQTLRTIAAHVVRDNADFRDLFTTRKTFLTTDLGSIYGVPAANPDEWVPYEFPAGDPRTGILTHISFTALYSQPGRTSPTRRGKAIREIFLCQKVPDPPPNVDFSKLQDPDPSLHTARDRLDAHRSNPACAGCHKITDPMGLGMEHFDGAGYYRAKENDVAIDARGALDGASFTDALGLARALRDNPRVSSCLTQRMLGYAMGRPLVRADDAWAKRVNDDFIQQGYRVKDLLNSIATSEAFYAVATASNAVKSTKEASNASPNIQNKEADHVQ